MSHQCSKFASNLILRQFSGPKVGTLRLFPTVCSPSVRCYHTRTYDASRTSIGEHILIDLPMALNSLPGKDLRHFTLRVPHNRRILPILPVVGPSQSSRTTCTGRTTRSNRIGRGIVTTNASLIFSLIDPTTPTDSGVITMIHCTTEHSIDSNDCINYNR